jgi:hypothetical protein
MIKEAIILVILSAPTEIFGAGEIIPRRIITRVQELVTHQTSPQVCFQSAESSHGLGVVNNCIQLFQDGTNDFWLMQQDIKLANHDVKNQVGIYIENRDKKPPLSYYLEIDRDVFETNKVVDLTAYKVPCANCHPSGPRVIRPTAESFLKMSAADKDRMTLWNKKIAEYKIVDTFVNSQNSAGLLSKSPKSHEQLRLPKCYECHNPNSGVRNSLTRGNQGVIDFLTRTGKDSDGNHPMPPVGVEPLDSLETQCLTRWLSGGESQGCAEAVASPPKTVQRGLNASKTDSLLDPVKSHLTVKVRTSLHDFNISGFGLKWELHKDNPEFAWHVDIGLNSIDTGIAARTWAVKKKMKTDVFPNIRVSGLGRPKAGAKQRVKVQILEITKDLDVDVLCQENSSDCVIGPTKVNLQNWQIKMTGYLGIKVDPVVGVSGRIVVGLSELNVRK